MENGFLTVKEASQYLGVKPSSLYSMVEEKEIPHYRVKRLIKFKKADLDAFMEERRVDRVDLEKEAKRILNHTYDTNIDVDSLVRKTVAESRGNGYTASHGKSDQTKGLGKEVSHGTL